MQFHHHGYVTGDPRIQTAEGTGVGRPENLPDVMDILIVGTGPAGMIAAAQLAQFPHITTRIIDKREDKLLIGQADGIQARSVETFEAFGFAQRLTAEAYRETEMAFWKPDPANPGHIVRTAVTLDDPVGISEFPHLLVNQARILDYFAEWMENSPTRMTPDYGWEFVDLEVDETQEYPVSISLVRSTGPDAGLERTVKAKYVVGADGAHSRVRETIGLKLEGARANHAWGVIDSLAVTDFPDIRTKCAVQSSEEGSILLIPREGGHLFRMYVDLGEADENSKERVRATTIEQIVERAQAILRPYTLDVKDVPWHSVYEVGHRLTSRFDDVPPEEAGSRTPRVFIAGDACHTHSAKAGQGMNVSMQDGWNIAWKLGHVLDGRAPAELLSTYSAERQVIAQKLIDFDREWSAMMAKRPDEMDDPTELEDYYVRTLEFPAGFMTEYSPSLLVGEPKHQALATGYPVGKRFKSEVVRRVCDGNDIHIGHLARADGRWRIYLFGPKAGGDQSLNDVARWLTDDPSSPLASHPDDAELNAWVDVKVVFDQLHGDVDITKVPRAFRPTVGPFELIDNENVFGRDPDVNVFESRGIDASGAMVVVRPDQYVANVLPLDRPEELGAFFSPILGVRSR